MKLKIYVVDLEIRPQVKEALLVAVIFFSVLFGGAVAAWAAFNDSWIVAGQPITATNLKSALDDLDSRVTGMATATARRPYIDMTIHLSQVPLMLGGAYFPITDPSLVVSQNTPPSSGAVIASIGGVNSVGVTFPTTEPGQVVRACTYLSVQLSPQSNVGTNVGVVAQFQIAETVPNSGTPIQAGSAHAVVSANKEYNNSNGVSAIQTIALCSRFSFATPGMRTLRLLGKVEVTGNSGAYLDGMSTDADIHRDIEFM